jgi:hypothetical protein
MLRILRRNLSSDGGLWVIFSIFVFTRGIAVLTGMRYVETEVEKFMQFIDLDILQHHLLRAL